MMETILFKAQLSRLQTRLDEAVRVCSNAQLTEYHELRKTLTEELSGSDWSKFSLAFGMLWNKLDQLIRAVQDTTRAVQTRR